MNTPPINPKYTRGNPASDLLRATVRAGGMLLLLPAIIALCALCLYPLGRGIARAISEGAVLTALTDGAFWRGAGIAALTVLLSAACANILGYAAARALLRCGKNHVITSALCVPWMMGIIGVCAAWKSVGGDVIAFPCANFLHNVLMLFWRSFGIAAVIYAVGLRALPQSANDEILLQGMSGKTRIFDMELPRMGMCVSANLLITIFLPLRGYAGLTGSTLSLGQSIAALVPLIVLALVLARIARGWEVRRA